MAGGKCWSHKTVTCLNHCASGQSNRVSQVNDKPPSNPFLSGTMIEKKRGKKKTTTTTKKNKNKKNFIFPRIWKLCLPNTPQAKFLGSILQK